MAKQRFRDIKRGRVTHPQYESRISRSKQEQAGVKDRIKAAITDSFMLVMPIMYIVFYLVFGGREGFAEHKLLGWLYILFPLVIIQIIFMIKSKLGQTPGMRAYNLTLVDTRTDQKPKAGVIVYRQILSLLSFFVLGWITMFFRKDSRTLHELLSSTTLHLIPGQGGEADKKER